MNTTMPLDSVKKHLLLQTETLLLEYFYVLKNTNTTDLNYLTDWTFEDHELEGFHKTMFEQLVGKTFSVLESRTDLDTSYSLKDTDLIWRGWVKAGEVFSNINLLSIIDIDFLACINRYKEEFTEYRNCPFNYSEYSFKAAEPDLIFYGFKARYIYTIMINDLSNRYNLDVLEYVESIELLQIMWDAMHSASVLLPPIIKFLKYNANGSLITNATFFPDINAAIRLYSYVANNRIGNHRIVSDDVKEITLYEKCTAKILNKLSGKHRVSYTPCSIHVLVPDDPDSDISAHFNNWWLDYTVDDIEKYFNSL